MVNRMRALLRNTTLGWQTALLGVIIDMAISAHVCMAALTIFRWDTSSGILPALRTTVHLTRSFAFSVSPIFLVDLRIRVGQSIKGLSRVLDAETEARLLLPEASIRGWQVITVQPFICYGVLQLASDKQSRGCTQTGHLKSHNVYDYLQPVPANHHHRVAAPATVSDVIVHEAW